jgi:PAS domain S-box-containing protein
MKLLLVDSSDERAKVLEDQLREAGSQASLMRVGTEAEIVSALEREHWDAVLCSAELADLGVASTLEVVQHGGDSSPAFVVLEANDDAQILERIPPPGTLPRTLGSRERRSLARATLDALPEAALVIDFDDPVAVMNDAFRSLWNVPAASSPEIHSLLRLLPETPRLIIELLERDGISRSSGFLDLGGRSVEWTSSPRCVDGEAIGRLWYFRDVTAATRAQQALERSEEKYRSLIGNAPAVLWTADAQGRITFVSPNVIALDGHTADEVCGGGKDGWLARVHPDDQKVVARAYAGLFAHDLAFDVEYRIRHKNGAWIWVHDRAVATYEAGGVRHADGVLLDITARKLAEIESNRLTHERELLFESAAEGIFGIDHDGRATFVNRAALEILGYRAEDLIGLPIHEMIHGTVEEPCRRSDCAAIQALQQGERRRSVDELFRRRDGSTFIAELNAAPIVADGRIRGAVVIFSDTSERRALERAVEQAQRVESLGRVAATMAHEFNNVLSAIAPFGEIVGRVAGNNAMLQTAADHIASSIVRGRRVTEEILRFTRPAPAELRPIEVVPALERLVGELSPSLPRSCVVDLFAEVQSPIVLADWPQIEQVITNLVFNARDAMEGVGRVVLEVAEPAGGNASPAIDDRSAYVDIRCIDQGCGMSPEIAARVFEPLFTTKRNGTGIGLAVAQQLVTRNGGMIYVESETGKGTTFHLLLKKAA